MRDYGQPMAVVAWLWARAAADGDCLEWRGLVHTSGAPLGNVEGRKHLVRRWLWLKLTGVAPRRAGCVVSSCDNPLCVAPGHLLQVSRSVLLRGKPKSADARRRVAMTKRQASRLSLQDVAAIRASEEKGKVLDARYGLSEGHASQIRRGLIWRDFTSPFAGLHQTGGGHGR